MKRKEKSNITGDVFEEVKPYKQKYVLRLYVAGMTSKSSGICQTKKKFL